VESFTSAADVFHLSDAERYDKVLQSMIPCDRLLLDGNKAILLVGGFWTPMLEASCARIASPFFWVRK